MDVQKMYPLVQSKKLSHMSSFIIKTWDMSVSSSINFQGLNKWTHLIGDWAPISYKEHDSFNVRGKISSTFHI